MAWSHSALVAEVYDIAHPLSESVGDVEFYSRAVADVRGRILEPACGTGRILIPLLEAGHAVDGVDHSPDMLEICRAYCEKRGLAPNLHAADVSTFVRPQAYEAVVMPRGSIRNVDGRAATLRTLECFRESLIPGGHLLIDVTIPMFIADRQPAIEHWTRDPYVYLCETLVAQYDPFHNRTIRYARYTKWDDGLLVETELHRYCFQHWNLREFHDLLELAGFVDVRVTGDFGADAPGADTRYWNFRARKGRA